MTAILTEYSNVQNAITFLDKYNGDESPIENRIYIGIGRDSSWTDDSNPPDPSNTVTDIEDFWSNSIAFQKLNYLDFTMVKPRVNWEAGKEFYTFDETANDSYYSNFYAVSLDSDDVWRVWEVWTKDNTSPPPTTSTAPTIETVVDDGSGNYIDDTGDGYTWRYLYNISTSDRVNILDQGWIPVNFDHKTTTEQSNYGLLDPARVLFSRHALVRVKLSDTEIPTNISYRQIAIVTNPKENISGEPLFTNFVGLMSSYNSPPEDDIVQNSGDLLYLENREPIPRSQDQQEELKIIIRF